jgi:hypothetical protein
MDGQPSPSQQGGAARPTRQAFRFLYPDAEDAAKALRTLAEKIATMMERGELNTRDRVDGDPLLPQRAIEP